MAVAEAVFAFPFAITMFSYYGAYPPGPESGLGALILNRAADLLLVVMVLVFAAIPAAVPPWILALAMSAAWVRVRRRRRSRLVEPSPHSSDSMPPGGGGGGADFDQTIG